VTAVSSGDARANSAPRGTLVMTTRNRADRAVEAVERALGLPDRWPVVVVDDASEDSTADRLRRRFGDAITVIRLERNVGGAARNAGVRAATTPLVAFFDDDSWWAPRSLTCAADVFATHPDVGLVAGHVVVEPGGRSDPVNELMAASPLEPTAAGPSVLGFLACAAVVRRDAYLSVGGFAPVLHIGGEETLLATDLRSAGWTLTYRSDVQVHHAPELSDDGRAGRRARQMRNVVLITVMRRPLDVATREMVALGRQALGDRDARAALRGVLRRLPAALSQRSVVDDRVERELRLLSMDDAPLHPIG
jgi:GT2 family glycosyltransferase